MADDAFALSPISARASMPTEADYEAICSAFMETARGRWFLGEYGKRNRNADTRMVLDAVERIEATLASQKAATHPSLAELLPAIASLIADAQQRILDTLPKADARPATEPIQRAAGVLRDVAWTLRESGADTRVCDLLDVQAKAIVDGCTRMHGDQLNTPDIPAAVAAALDTLAGQISALARADVPASASEAQAPAPPADFAHEEAQAQSTQTAVSATTTLDVVAPNEATTARELMPVRLTEHTAGAKQKAAAEHPDSPQDSKPLTMVEVDVQANLWEDLEITDIDPDEAAAKPDAVAGPAAAKPPPVVAQATAAGPVSSIADRQIPEPATVVDDAPRAVPNASTQAAIAAAAPEMPQKPAPSSLGQAALEGGAVTALSGRYLEALAPIRRMSQAERVAFFS